jgi:elongation of very long chain fatty acids protein 6
MITSLSLRSHAATLICAYWLQASHSQVMYLFVSLNASIHTVMYFYYSLTIIGVRLGGKALITTGQIAQFFVGIAMALPTFYLRGGSCANPAQTFALVAIVAHAAYLIKLFSEFYTVAYKKEAKSI